MERLLMQEEKSSVSRGGEVREGESRELLRRFLPEWSDAERDLLLRLLRQWRTLTAASHSKGLVALPDLLLTEATKCFSGRQLRVSVALLCGLSEGGRFAGEEPRVTNSRV